MQAIPYLSHGERQHWRYGDCRGPLFIVEHQSGRSYRCYLEKEVKKNGNYVKQRNKINYDRKTNNWRVKRKKPKNYKTIWKSRSDSLIYHVPSDRISVLREKNGRNCGSLSITRNILNSHC